jgi:hypothetical protein
MNTTESHQNLGKRLFWISVIVSGIAGIKVGPILAVRILMAAPIFSDFWVVSLLAFKVLTAIVASLVFYRIFAWNALARAEAKSGVVIDRPSMMRGMIYSALIPFILGILGLALMFLLAGSGMHDSM